MAPQPDPAETTVNPTTTPKGVEHKIRDLFNFWQAA